MSDFQSKVHKAIQESIQNEIKGLPDEFTMDLSDDDEDHEGGSVLGKFALLMQTADHVGLLAQSKSSVAKQVLEKMKPKVSELEESPKFEWVMDFIEQRLASDPKAKTIIFSRYERVVDMLAQMFAHQGINVVIHTGKMNQQQRQEAKQKFWDDANIFISTDSGAEGINLQCADVLINLDLPWNPSKYIQRWGRIKRAGSQHKHVKVVNLICRDSVDQRIKEIFYNKQSVFDVIVEGSEDEKAKINSLTKNILLKLASNRRKKSNGEKV
jgi:SNF2 family DNA or RNA helicase